MNPHITSPMSRTLARLLLALLLTSISLTSAAELEIIELENRNAAELIPLVSPFVEQGGTVSGTGFQLIIRTSPDNLREIKTIVERLDSVVKRLLITVKQVSEDEYRDLVISARARLSTQSDSKIRIDAQRHHTTERDSSSQQVQVLEGNSAWIRLGQSIPVGERSIHTGPGGTEIQESIRYKSLTTGFYVVPRVHEDQVTLYISPHKFTQSRDHGGVINLQQAQTTLRGPLGEWLLIGGTGAEEQHQGSGYTYQTRKRGEQQGHIVVRVEELY